MKRVAVFGSKGYLGSQLIRYAERLRKPADGFDMPDCDILDPDFWHSFDASRYETVFFFAGMTGTERSFEQSDKFLDVNERGLLNLLEVMKELGPAAPKIVFPSTRLVYAGSETPLSEDSAKNPKTVYAANKLACEGYLSAYASRYGIRYAVVRICVPFGSICNHNLSYGTISHFISTVKRGDPITVFGDGDVRRTFTHASDICKASFALAEREENGIYNIGGVPHSIKEVADCVARELHGRVVHVECPHLAALHETGTTVFCSKKIDSVVRIDYIDIMDGIRMSGNIEE